MKKKSQNIINNWYSLSAIGMLLLIWQALCSFEIVPRFMLPSPMDVGNALIQEFPLLLFHAKTTLLEACVGLLLGVAIGFITAILMDQYERLYQALYPLIVLTQTIPTVAIAPLLVLWLGYEMTPKVVLIIIVTFFPVTVGVFNGLRCVDNDTIQLLRSMGANKFQIFYHVKFPSALNSVFSSIRIAASYSIVGAVISEWLGGTAGLGVYMTRVRKSFAFDKMFAVIFLISALSLFVMALIDIIQKKSMPWEREME